MEAMTAAASNKIPVPMAGDDRAGKYLAFQLGKEEYAIRVLKVREIIGVQEITTVPQTPDYIRGVFNLRGKVIPVVDLQRKFGFATTENNARTCIVVVEVASAGRVMLMGILVDAVSEVRNIAAGDIEDTPDFGRDVSVPYLLGVAKSKGQVNLLLDIDSALRTHEVEVLSSMAVS